jgi:glycosyltransferase involved in cell wall biosynthesis
MYVSCRRDCERVLIHGRYNGLLFEHFQVYRKVVFDVRDNMVSPNRYPKRGKFICCSEHIRSNLDNGFRKLSYIAVPPPSEIDTHKKDYDGDLKKRILFVGGTSKLKGFHHLIESIQSYPNKVKLKQYLSLIIVGELKTDIADLCIEYNLTRNFFDEFVTFKGSLGKKNMLREIALANLVVIPSDKEGVPRVALEASYVGTPIAVNERIEEFNCLPDDQKITTSNIEGSIHHIFDKLIVGETLKAFNLSQYPGLDHWKTCMREIFENGITDTGS